MLRPVLDSNNAIGAVEIVVGLALAGIAVLGDGLYALSGGHVPWLRQLLLLR